jgi:hypothetical protein
VTLIRSTSFHRQIYKEVSRVLVMQDNATVHTANSCGEELDEVSGEEVRSPRLCSVILVALFMGHGK